MHASRIDSKTSRSSTARGSAPPAPTTLPRLRVGCSPTIDECRIQVRSAAPAVSETAKDERGDTFFTDDWGNQLYSLSFHLWIIGVVSIQLLFDISFLKLILPPLICRGWRFGRPICAVQDCSPRPCLGNPPCTTVRNSYYVRSISNLCVGSVEKVLLRTFETHRKSNKSSDRVLYFLRGAWWVHNRSFPRGIPHLLHPLIQCISLTSGRFIKFKNMQKHRFMFL
jgi:hypothetical protein